MPIIGSTDRRSENSGTILSGKYNYQGGTIIYLYTGTIPVLHHLFEYTDYLDSAMKQDIDFHKTTL